MYKIMQEFEQGYVMFGEIGIDIAIDENKTFWFCANDIAINLGYKFHYDAVKKHVNAKDTKQIKNIQNRGGHPNKLYLNFVGTASLILRSKLTFAQGFSDWLFDTVMPAMHDYKKYCSYKENKLNLKSAMDKVNYLLALKKYYEKLVAKKIYSQNAIIYAQVLYNDLEDELEDESDANLVSDVDNKVSENIDNDPHSEHDENTKLYKYKLVLSTNINALKNMNTEYYHAFVTCEKKGKNDTCSAEKLFILIKVLLLDCKHVNGEYHCKKETMVQAFNDAKSQIMTYSFDQNINTLRNTVISLSGLDHCYVEYLKKYE